MKLSDRALLIAAAAGEESAFERLYHRFSPRLEAYFFLRCGENQVVAEDLVQELFLQLLRSRHFQEPRNGPENLSPLFFSMAANLLKNHYRQKERRNRRLKIYRDTQDNLISASTEFSDDGSNLQQALSSLPFDQRQCVQLRYRGGLSVAEIAELLKCPMGTVKSRLHYGLKKMAELLPQNLLHDQ